LSSAAYRRAFLAVVLCALGPVTSARAAPPASSEPVVVRLLKEADAQFFTFGPRDAHIPARFGSSRILWQLGIALPRGARLRDVIVPSWAPAILRLTDGRCFNINLDTSNEQLNEVTVTPGCPNGTQPPPAQIPTPPAPGLTYKGRTWLMDVWNDPSTGVTTIYSTSTGRSIPLLSARVPVLAVGGMGSPDTPQTELSLVCLMRHRLRMITFNLISP